MTLHLKKSKKQTIPWRNYKWCRPCRWSSAPYKYTWPSRILQHNLEPTARCISIYKNVNKTELICFKQEWAISTLSVIPLNLKKAVRIPQQQYLFFWTRYTPREGVRPWTDYQSFENLISPKTQLLCQYPLGSDNNTGKSPIHGPYRSIWKLLLGFWV